MDIKQLLQDNSMNEITATLNSMCQELPGNPQTPQLILNIEQDYDYGKPLNNRDESFDEEFQERVWNVSLRRKTKQDRELAKKRTNLFVNQERCIDSPVYYQYYTYRHCSKYDFDLEPSQNSHDSVWAKLQKNEERAYTAFYDLSIRQYHLAVRSRGLNKHALRRIKYEKPTQELLDSGMLSPDHNEIVITSEKILQFIDKHNPSQGLILKLMGLPNRGTNLHNVGSKDLTIFTPAERKEYYQIQQQMRINEEAGAFKFSKDRIFPTKTISFIHDHCDTRGRLFYPEQHSLQSLHDNGYIDFMQHWQQHQRIYAYPVDIEQGTQLSSKTLQVNKYLDITHSAFNEFYKYMSDTAPLELKQYVTDNTLYDGRIITEVPVPPKMKALFETYLINFREAVDNGFIHY